MTAETYERTFALTGCGNFRDLGGYEAKDGRRTRWRTLFRSDALHQLNDQDIDVLGDAGIRLALGFDLRSARELENTGQGTVYERGARHVHVPLIQTIASNSEVIGQMQQMQRLSYFDRLADAIEPIGQIFDLLAESGTYPAVFYCAAGKDRTGIVAALILRAIGVSDDDIVADYMLTQPTSPERREARMRELGLENLQLNPKLFEASDEAMRTLLSTIDETHGSVEGYLTMCGIESRTIERVQDHLLE
jgi:protein-tyrosine phosphatase